MTACETLVEVSGSGTPRIFWLFPLAGLLLSLAFPTELLPGRFGDHPPSLLGWLAVLPLLWAMQALPPRQARWAAYLFGFGWYLGVITWVRLFGLLPWALLTAFLALTPLLAVLVSAWMPGGKRWTPLTFALAFTGLEWLRGQGMFGFPWAELGSTQVDGLFARIAAVGGIPLITFLMLWVTGSLLQRIRDPKSLPWMLPVSLAGLLLALLGGWWQSHAAYTRWQQNSSGQYVSVVQPNVLRDLSPEVLHTGVTVEERNRRFQVLLGLSYDACFAQAKLQAAHGQAKTAPPAIPHLIVWPESALADPLDDPTQPASSTLPAFCGITRSYVLAGGPFGFANAAQLVEPPGVLGERYEKTHLVPFGEFVPFRPLIERYYTVRAYDIQPGRSRQPLRATGHAFGVGICFESTFADLARESARQGAQLLVYITNDAWFHQTAAVRQHYNEARFRALETGLPVARAAATGISGFIAPDGRSLDEIPTYQPGTRTRFFHDGTPGTLTTSGGWLFGPCCLCLALALALVGKLFMHRCSSNITTSP